MNKFLANSAHTNCSLANSTVLFSLSCRCLRESFSIASRLACFLFFYVCCLKRDELHSGCYTAAVLKRRAKHSYTELHEIINSSTTKKKHQEKKRKKRVLKLLCAWWFAAKHDVALLRTHIGKYNSLKWVQWASREHPFGVCMEMSIPRCSSDLQ